jgi:hypothetical protein
MNVVLDASSASGLSPFLHPRDLLIHDYTILFDAKPLPVTYGKNFLSSKMLSSPSSLSRIRQDRRIRHRKRLDGYYDYRFRLQAHQYLERPTGAFASCDVTTLAFQ